MSTHVLISAFLQISTHPQGHDFQLVPPLESITESVQEKTQRPLQFSTLPPITVFPPPLNEHLGTC